MKELIKAIKNLFMVIFFILLSSLLMGFIIQKLWNWTIPDLTNNNISHITYWKSVGLYFLTFILFKNPTIENKKSVNTDTKQIIEAFKN